MRHYWLRDKETHEYILVYWDIGDNNEANYFIKKHLTEYHKLKRSG